MILTAGMGLGYCKSYGLTRRERALSAVLKMVILLKGEIRCQNASLPEAFSAVAGKMSGMYREFLRECARQMRQGAGKPLGEIFRESVFEKLKECGLTLMDLEGVANLGGRLGYLDLQMQLRQLELYETELSETLSGLRREMPRKKKLYQSLGISFGAMIAILVS